MGGIWLSDKDRSWEYLASFGGDSKEVTGRRSVSKYIPHGPAKIQSASALLIFNGFSVSQSVLARIP